MESPSLSVVMPVHNALPFLEECIESILKQTLTDFEFVILDDASTDGSTELLRQWSLRDSRIRLHETKKQFGLAGSSNAVVAKARPEVRHLNRIVDGVLGTCKSVGTASRRDTADSTAIERSPLRLWLDR